MSEKNIKSRIIHKHDTEANWIKATNFVPKKGEIIIYDGSGSTASKFKIGDGSTSVNSLPFAGGGSQAATGSATMPIYWDGTQYKTINSFPEKYLSWGGKNIVGDIAPIDAAMSYMHSANRLQFAKPAGITIEYSNNGGSTWTDYGASDTEKVGLVSGIRQNFRYGKRTTPDTAATVNDKLRIIFNANICYTYTNLKTVLVDFSHDGARGCNVLVEKSTIGEPDTYTTVGKYDISGRSGWNSLSIIEVFGGYQFQTSQTLKLRFTFSCTSVTSTSRPTVIRMMFFGTTNWVIPSNMANTGHIYTWDANQNAIFPAAVTATAFNGNATSATKVNGHTVNSDVPANAKFTDTVYSLPPATSSVLGGVKIGSGITVTADGTISAASSYTLPTASTSTKGGIKVGSGLTMNSETLNHSNSITAKTAYGSTATTASANGGSITVTDVKYDAQGHITGSTDRKITLSQTTYTLAGLGGVPTSRTINGKALSSNITLTAGDVGAATSSALNSYLPLSGGSLTGNLTVGGNLNVNAAQWPQIAFNVVNSSGASAPASMLGSLRSTIDTAESTFVRTYVSSTNYKDWYFTKDGNFIAPGNLYSAIGGTNYRVWNQYNMKSGTSLPVSGNTGDVFFLYS